MFEVIAGESDLDLYCQSVPVLQGLTVHVEFDDCSVITLPCHSVMKESMAIHCLFQLDDDLELILSFRPAGDIVQLSVSAQINKGISWPGQTFHPLRALQIKVAGLGDINGLLAHHLYNSWWTRPHFGVGLDQLPTRTQSILCRNPSQQYRFLQTFCDERIRGEIQGGEAGLVIHAAPIRSGERVLSGAFLLLGVGDEPFDLINETVSIGRGLLSYDCKDRNERRIPDMFNYLGWCSWDACYTDVDEQAVLAKAAEFQKKGVPVRWVLVDDGWSEEANRRLKSFKENFDKFPSGIKGLKHTLSSDYGVKWLGVWQALTGHWEGLDTSAQLPDSLLSVCDPVDNQRCLPPSNFTDAFRFWHAWHDYLAKQGVDFVKVDVQSNLGNHYRYKAYPGQLAQEVHQALEASAALHFGGAMINCMGMAVEQLWYRPTTALSRNSDDFFPKQPGNLREHALQNAYNSVFHSAFYQGDLDMWWTQHEDALAHAVLRVLSGGPIYTSDPVGETDADMLNRLVFNNGLVVHCDEQGRADISCLFEDPCSNNRLLKIKSRVGDVGVLGVFNISDADGVIGSAVSPVVVDSVEERLLMYSVLGESVEELEPQQTTDLLLAKDDCELLLFYPDRDLFCLGLADKLLPCCAVIRQWRMGDTLHVHLRQGGAVLLFSRLPVREVRVNGEKLAWQEKDSLLCVQCSEWQTEIRLTVQAGDLAEPHLCL